MFLPMKILKNLIYYKRNTVLFCSTTEYGFTLIELMVVVIIMGVLTAIALPNIISQVGKARKAEAKELLNSIGFAQQGYYFEYRQFAPTYADMGLTFDSKYYDFSEPDSSSPTTYTKSNAVAKEGGKNSNRSYSLGVYYVSNSYQITLCQSSNATTTTEVADILNGACTNGGQKIN